MKNEFFFLFFLILLSFPVFSDLSHDSLCSPWPNISFSECSHLHRNIYNVSADIFIVYNVTNHSVHTDSFDQETFEDHILDKVYELLENYVSKTEFNEFDSDFSLERYRADQDHEYRMERLKLNWSAPTETDSFEDFALKKLEDKRRKEFLCGIDPSLALCLPKNVTIPTESNISLADEIMNRFQFPECVVPDFTWIYIILGVLIILVVALIVLIHQQQNKVPADPKGYPNFLKKYFPGSIPGVRRPLLVKPQSKESDFVDVGKSQK